MSLQQPPVRTIILGAAGMDYHCFNLVFRHNPSYNVLAFTYCTEQNLGTVEADEVRVYPKELAGSDLYPKGIPFIPESKLAEFIQKENVQLAVFAYSDISHVELMHRASTVLAAGADFQLINPKKLQLKSSKPVLSVCAVRTGVGKSSVSRKAVRYFQEKGLRVVAIREPMPYDDLVKQTNMRFATMEDLDIHKASVEEREEYEPYVLNGMVIYSGVDYAKILQSAEQEADVIVFDGGNNEISFLHPDKLLVLADPLRPGHENQYHPGEANCRMADVFVVAKAHEASLLDMTNVEATLKDLQPRAETIRIASCVRFEHDEKDAARVAGKRVLVIEDGPTTTHGGQKFGAGYVMAKKHRLDIVDPRPFAVGSLRECFHNFPHLENVLPAMGYNQKQLDDLANTINASDADVVLNGSPSDLAALLGSRLKKPMVRVLYDVDTFGEGKGLEAVFDDFLRENRPMKASL